MNEDKTGSIWSPDLLPITVANLTIVAVAAFDGLAVTAALPSIGADLGRVALLPWVITAYLAASSISIIVAGPVIDAIGVRRTFRITAIWFLITTALAAIAPDLPSLLVARAAQGMGGGLATAVALSSVGLAYPARLRPRAFAMNSLVWGTMGFGGPALVAGLLTFGDWRLMFVTQLPLTAVALAAGWRTLPSTRDRPVRPDTDVPGILLLAGLTIALLLGLSQIGVRWWASGVAGGMAIILMALYWSHSGRAVSPVLKRNHLSGRPLGMIHLTAGLVLAAGLAADNYLPLYVRASRGHSIEFAAFSVVYLTVGWTLASFLASRLLDRHSEATIILAGAVWLVPAVALSGLAVALGAPLPLIFAGYAAIGAAIGLTSTAGLTLLQADTDPGEMGRVNAAHQFLRTLAITYGVALGGGVILFVVQQRVGDVEPIRELLAGTDSDLGSATRDSVASGLAWVHVVATALAVICAGVAVRLWRSTAGTPASV